MCQEKKNKKDKDKKSKGPKIFNPEDGGVPKLKIKTVPPKVEPEVPSTPKLVIKNIVKEETPAKEPSSSSSKSLPPPSSTPRGRPPKIKEEKHSHKRKREEESKSRKHRDSKRHKSRESIDDDDDDDGPSSGIITETVGSYTDESGNTIWICPACGKQDDGSPMIGCDECDDWYHWLCVGINAEPKDNQDWFCTRCIAKKGGLYKGGKKK